MSNSSSSEDVCASSSGVPVRLERHGKPVVDLSLATLQLKSATNAVRDNLNSYEEWGFSAKRLKNVTGNPVCKCKRTCYKQLPREELSSLCMWYHGHLSYVERQYVIQILYQQATNDDSGVTVLDEHEDHDRVPPRVQWRLQGSPVSHKHPALQCSDTSCQ